jgi:hypothetical protein
VQVVELGEGITLVSLVCEDLARLDEVADLLRAIGPTLVVTTLLDGPQLASRWTARYASVLADDPGFAVVVRFQVDVLPPRSVARQGAATIAIPSPTRARASDTSILVSREREERRHMTEHATGTREEWLTVRIELLAAEKEHTRRGDELARQRQALPWVPIDQDYRFKTDEGSASLSDLFRGRSQLLVYHFMFGPDYTAGCPACSAIADGFDGFAIHLANHDVMLWAVSRAPFDKLQAYKQRMGWSFPWASSNESDFNFDFDVSLTEE